MDDLIERAEEALASRWFTKLLRELIEELKAAHKEMDWLHGELDRLRVRGDY